MYKYIYIYIYTYVLHVYIYVYYYYIHTCVYIHIYIYIYITLFRTPALPGGEKRVRSRAKKKTANLLFINQSLFDSLINKQFVRANRIPRTAFVGAARQYTSGNVARKCARVTHRRHHGNESAAKTWTASRSETGKNTLPTALRKHYENVS